MSTKPWKLSTAGKTTWSTKESAVEYVRAHLATLPATTLLLNTDTGEAFDRLGAPLRTLSDSQYRTLMQTLGALLGCAGIGMSPDAKALVPQLLGLGGQLRADIEDAAVEWTVVMIAKSKKEASDAGGSVASENAS